MTDTTNGAQNDEPREGEAPGSELDAAPAASTSSTGSPPSGKPWPRLSAPVRSASAVIVVKMVSSVTPEMRCKWPGGEYIPAL